jgi:hypothetical protein
VNIKRKYFYPSQKVKSQGTLLEIKVNFKCFRATRNKIIRNIVMINIFSRIIKTIILFKMKMISILVNLQILLRILKPIRIFLALCKISFKINQNYKKNKFKFKKSLYRIYKVKIKIKPIKKVNIKEKVK